MAQFSSSGVTTFVDKTAGGTLALSGSPALGSNLPGGIGGFAPIYSGFFYSGFFYSGFFYSGFFYSGFFWSGSIDELVIFNGIVDITSVPSSPFAGTEPNLVDLYHLDGNADDSGPATYTMIDPSNTALLYSPYNWYVQSGSARTINSGAYFRTLFTGTSVALRFNTAANQAPYSELVARIDNGAWLELTLVEPASGGSQPVTIPVTSALDNHEHLLEVMVKSTSETITRWANPNATMIVFTGLVLDGGAVVLPPARRSKNAVVFGDSITEGVRTINATAPNDTDRNDVRADYSYATLAAQDCEFGVIGFGATGMTVSGSGSVPPLTQSYNLIAPGLARDFSTYPPDLILINHGANDSGAGASDASFISAYSTVVGALQTVAPNARFLLLRPFGGYMAADVPYMHHQEAAR